jgi:hypothetical protein
MIWIRTDNESLPMHEAPPFMIMKVSVKALIMRTLSIMTMSRKTLNMITLIIMALRYSALWT